MFYTFFDMVLKRIDNNKRVLTRYFGGPLFRVSASQGVRNFEWVLPIVTLGFMQFGLRTRKIADPISSINGGLRRR